MKNIVCVTGGIFSTTLLEYVSKERGKFNILYSDIGQKAKTKELEYIENLCDKYKSKLEKKYILNHTRISNIIESALTHEDICIPDGNLNKKNIDFTYVPLWITRILVDAVNIAYTLTTEFENVRIYIGIHDKENLHNPEYNLLYISLFNKLIQYALPYGKKIDVFAPFYNFGYNEIINLAKSYDLDLKNTWSCFDGKDSQCGICDKCLYRKKYNI